MYVLSNKLYFLNKCLVSVFTHVSCLWTHKAFLPTKFPVAESAALLMPELPSTLASAELISHLLFTFLCYANKRWLPRCQLVDKSPLWYISISAHLQGKQFLWFSAELRVGCQFEARVQHAGRCLVPQAASTWADPALIYADIKLKWLSWSHYCYSGFALGRKQEQNLSQDRNISRLICPLYTLAASGIL